MCSIESQHEEIDRNDIIIHTPKFENENLEFSLTFRRL